MKTIKEMLEARGFVVTDSRSTTPKMRVMAQAKSMLAKLDKMKSVDELNSETSNQNWWMPQAVDGQRRLIMRYGGSTVPETSIYVENTLAGVRRVLEGYIDTIEETTDEHWRLIEQQRAEDQAKRKKKAATGS